MKKVLFIAAIVATGTAATAQPQLPPGAPPSAEQKPAHANLMLKKEMQLLLTQTTAMLKVFYTFFEAQGQL